MLNGAPPLAGGRFQTKDGTEGAPNPAEALELPTLEVIGTTLLPGLGTPARDVPANIQVHTQQELGTQRQSSLADYLEQNLTGVPNAVQATKDRMAIDQNSVGLGLQLTHQGQFAGKKNQLMIGAGVDFGRTGFIQDTQDAQFNANRGTDPIGPFLQQTSVATGNRYYGLFAAHTLTLDQRWTLSLSGRYNLARIRITDRSGKAPELNGEHSFARFNPALGLNFNPAPNLMVSAAYNEGMRAPTPIELTSADPTAPCKLPNNFLSDPALKKVVTKTIKVGARGKRGAAASWSVALYRTDLNDDIQFISSQGAGSNSGFFQNVGNTRRQGLELAGSGKWGRLALTAHRPLQLHRRHLSECFSDDQPGQFQRRCHRLDCCHAGQPDSRHPAPRPEAADRLCGRRALVDRRQHLARRRHLRAWR